LLFPIAAAARSLTLRSRSRSLSLSLVPAPPFRKPKRKQKNRFAIREERDYVTQDDFMRAVRKLCDAKKLESTLNYDSAFGDGGQK
jgi:hypothetical protein